MLWEKDVGKISEIPLTGKRYEWVISDFFSLPQNTDSRIISSEFRFEDQTCCLGLWPCIINSDGAWIGLNLWVHPNHYPQTLDVNIKLGILSHDGFEYKSCSVQCKDEYAQKKLFSYEEPNFLLKSKLMQEINMIAPYGNITVFCEFCMKKDAEEVVTLKKFSFKGPEIWAA